MSKVCSKCGEMKELKEFYRSRSTHRKECKKCSKVATCPLKIKDRNLRQNYGINLETYNRMLSEQEGSCKICGLTERIQNRSLAVDHCHKTGVVRGLLCSACNIALGKFEDDINRLERAIKYLRR
ncbi:endonuclease VII [Rahnella phage Sarma103]|nr:endonuclease VII [Rahnella phage Sarma103]